MEIDLVEPEMPEELRNLVALCLDRMEEEGSSALDAICRAHPEHAEALKRRVEALVRMGFVEVKGAPAKYPERLGEFRLLRQLGGGGMGVVYLAEQEPLGRQVALKLIRPEHLFFPGARERFRREVEAVARLQHPGIVPVYTVGEADGVPYFAMEHVAGKTIAQCIAELRATGKSPDQLTADDLRKVLGARVSTDSGVRDSTNSGTNAILRGRWVQICLRIAREVAYALAHAHERGVLHRDVKPSNVMITPEGRVLLLDFGLAISEHSSPLTRSGALVGSLPYMAPEQVAGDADSVGPATDVYALGVTLYELFTLRQPYSNSIADELQRAIIDGRAESASSHNPALPWDAETVCLTAMDSEIARRYASADAFARDLTNVLELRPIEARRPGPVLRARRFVQRHPTAVLGVAFAFLILVGGPAFYATLERARRVQVDLLNVDLKALLAESKQQRARAERNYDGALTAIDSMLSEVGDDDLANVPLMEGVRRRLLERALELYETLGDDPSAGVAVASKVAAARARIGQILILLGRREDAKKQLEIARDAYLELAKTDLPELRAEHQRNAARVSVDLAVILREDGNPDAARTQLDHARVALEQTLAKHGDEPSVRAELGRADFEESRLHALRGDVETAETLARRAIDRIKDLPKTSGRAIHLSQWWNEIGVMLMQIEASYPARIDDIEQVFRNAIEASEEFASVVGADPNLRIAHATAIQDLAGHYRRLERFAEAEALYLRSLAELESLAAAHPERVEARRQLATVINNLGLVAELTGRHDEAARRYGEVVVRLEELCKAMPAFTDLLANLGVAWMNYAFQAQRVGDLPEEAARLEKARAALAEARRLNPEGQAYRAILSNVLAGLVKSLHASGRREEVVRTARALSDNWPENPGLAMRGMTWLAKACDMLELDAELDEARRAELRVAYAAEALVLARRAKELGFDQWSAVGIHPDFAPLREVAEFRAGLRELGLEIDEPVDR